jgi:hypothetical protein
MSKHAHGKGRTTSKKIRRLMVTGIIVAVFALGAMAAVSLRTNPMKVPAPRQSTAQSADARANLRYQDGGVPINPQTGQVRPLTQEEAQSLAANIKQLVNQSTDGLQEVRHADGSVSMDLQGHFQNMVVTKRNENGEWVMSCVDNRGAAAAFFGIDPQLVGVKKESTAPQGTPSANSSAQPKGELR